LLQKIMPATNADKFIKVAPNTGWQVDASGISDASVTSFGLVSATSLPTDTAVILTIDRVNSSGVATPSLMERIVGVMSGTTVTSCVRGLEGTAQAHAAGAVVEIVISKSNINKLMEGILAEHNQDGSHQIDALDGIRYAADAGGDDTYAVTLTPAPSAYYAGMEVNFKPTTANTGACTLDVNGLGAKTIKKSVSTDLSTGDILAGQLLKVIYDGTNFQLVSTLPSSASPVTNYAPAPAGTATLDLSVSKRNTITMPAGNITVALSNVTVGDIFTIDITQDGTGSRTVTWFSTIRWAGGSAPTLTTTASKRDTFGFVCTGSGTYDGYVIGFNI
jgi:hypothetical protein